MKTYIFIFFHFVSYSLISFSSLSALAQDITTCVNPEGLSYYHYSEAVSSKDSGWSQDKISNGRLTLKKISNTEFDILILDATKSIFSLRQDGGEIFLMRSSENDATFLHFFQGKVIELYTFWKDSNGQFKYDLIQSKGGSTTRVHKSSILIGTSTPIDFKLLQ